MNSLKDFVHQFMTQDRGSIAVTFAGTFLMLTSAVGVAIDFGRAITAKQRLQTAVDQAAIAAASLPATASANRISQAERVFNSNTANSSLAGVTPSIQASNAGVTVTASYLYPTVLMKLFNVDTLSLSASTTARSQVQNGGVACLISLNPLTDDGLHLQGINKLASENCWTWVNSTSSQAINAVGASTGLAQGFCSVGGVMGSEHFHPAPYTGCEPMEDPFASLNIPTAGACTANNKQVSNGATTLTPGVYCGGIDIKPQAHVVFAPGLYFIKDGKFEIQANSTAIGNGVVFVFEGEGAELIVRGGGNLNIKAPAAGQASVSGLEGFVLVQNRHYTTAGKTTVIQGGGDIKIEGILYMPTWRVDIGGNGDLNQNSQYFTAVADSFYMEGNGKLYVKSNAANAGLPDLMPRIKNGPLLLN